MAAPALSGLQPSGGVLGEQTPITFVVSNADLRVIVAVEYAALRFTELVHDGTSFSVAYSATSSVNVTYDQQQMPIYTFSILRSPVWPGVPVLKVYAFNTAGQEL